MGDPIEESLQRIMDRAKQRREKQGHNDENSFSGDLPSKSQGKTVPAPPPPTIMESSYREESFTKTTTTRARFSALAQDLDQFEYDHKPLGSRSKETFLKGSSPRMSFGETRPSILFTPGAGRSPLKEVSPLKQFPAKSPQKEEERRIRFAHPIARTTIADESGMDESGAHESSSTVGTYSPREVTSYADESRREEKTEGGEEEEYGAHTFLKKGSRSRNTSSSSLISSPKPFSPSVVNASHSPVRFNPSASSPKFAEARVNISHTIPLDISSISPARTSNSGGSIVTGRVDVLAELERAAKEATTYSSPSQITPSSAKHFFAQLPSKSPVRPSGPPPEESSSPIRSAALSSHKATTIRKELEEKLRSGEATMPLPAPSSLPAMRTQGSRIAPPKGSITPSMPSGVRTQWRGTTNTPVVSGADKDEKTKADVRAANISSLRNRWEFSAATGTPLHPDKTERDLMEEAQKEADKATYNKSFTRDERMTPRKKMRDEMEGRKSLTSSPVGKSPRLRLDSEESVERHEPEGRVIEEEAMFDSDSEREEDEDEELGNASSIIDQAFEFMEGRAAVTSPPKPLRQASITTPERIEEDAEAERRAEEEETRAREERERWQREDRERRQKEEKKEDERRAHEERERQQPRFTAPPPPKEEEQEEEGGDKPGLAHTVSFYRKRRAETKTGQNLLIDYRGRAVSPAHQVIGVEKKKEYEVDEKEIQKEEARLKQSLTVQQEQITQASRALAFCRETQFRGSREEVDAQRALLIATESRRSLLKGLEDVRAGVRHADGPRGAMAISSIIIPLSNEFSSGSTMGGHGADGTLYYFIVLLRHGSQVHHTALLSSEDAARRKGVLEFAQYLRLEHLPPDFSCTVEVWGLRTRREQIAHDEKYKLKSGTLKKKDASFFSSFKPGSSSSSSQPSQPSYLPAVGDTSFQCIGRLTLDINSVDRRKFSLVDACHPLDGTVQLKIKRYAMEKGDVLHRGFLSLYQRSPQGLGSWTRYWCVVENGEMKFWRSPEDEATKDWLVLIDLTTCVEGVGQETQDMCPFPNSFHVDVWVPKDGATSSREMERLRVLMAADRKEDLALWLEILNKTIRNLLLWTNQPKAH